MIHDVLVPVDGSEAALAALGPASTLAHYLDIEVVVVAYYRSPEERAELESVLPEQLKALDGVRSRLELLFAEGSVGDALAEYLGRQPGRLAVMATRGRGRTAAVLGSVASAVLSKASGPILLVGPGYERSRFRCHGPLLAAVPHSDHARLILPTAQVWATVFDFDLELFAAFDPMANVVVGSMPMVVLPPESRSELEADLAALADRVTETIGRPATHHLSHNVAAARGLVARAQETSAAAIAMVTHNPRGLERAILGSITADVVKHAPCPVLVLRPHLIDLDVDAEGSTSGAIPVDG